jgi:hypothetical protein
VRNSGRRLLWPPGPLIARPSTSQTALACSFNLNLLHQLTVSGTGTSRRKQKGVTNANKNVRKQTDKAVTKIQNRTAGLQATTLLLEPSQLHILNCKRFLAAFRKI